MQILECIPDSLSQNHEGVETGESTCSLAPPSGLLHTEGLTYSAKICAATVTPKCRVQLEIRTSVELCPPMV